MSHSAGSCVKEKVFFPRFALLSLLFSFQRGNSDWAAEERRKAECLPRSAMSLANLRGLMASSMSREEQRATHALCVQ